MAYYSKGDRIHCVRPPVITMPKILDTFPVFVSFRTLTRPDGTAITQNITDFVVLEVDGVDALVLVIAVTIATFKAGFPNFGRGQLGFQEHTVPNLEVGTSNILQLSTDSTSVYTVRRSLSVGLMLAVGSWQDESVRSIPLQWDFSQDVAELSPSDVTLSVSPQRIVLIVLQWPGGDKVIMFVSANEATLRGENIVKHTFTKWIYNIRHKDRYF